MRFSNGFQNTFTKLIFLGAAFVFLGTTAQTIVAQENSTKVSQASLIPEAEKLLTDLGYWIKKVDGKPLRRYKFPTLPSRSKRIG